MHNCFRIIVNGRTVYEEAMAGMTYTMFSLWDDLPAEYQDRGLTVKDVRYLAGQGLTVYMEGD